MMAILLAGGKGTRLKPFTVTLPKPLLPLGDIPIVEIIIKQLIASGIKRIVLTLGHMAPFFAAYIGNGKRWGAKIEYCVEEEPLGTAGPLRLIKNLEKDFLIMNGDILTTFNYQNLITKHRKHKAWGSIALSRREIHIDYGVAVTGKNNFLSNYLEKPVIPYEVSMGINVLSRSCLAFIPRRRKFDMPDLLLAMHRAGKPVICHKTSCYWQDIGRFDDYQRASEDFSQNPQRFLPRKRV